MTYEPAETLPEPPNNPHQPQDCPEIGLSLAVILEAAREADRLPRCEFSEPWRWMYGLPGNKPALIDADHQMLKVYTEFGLADRICSTINACSGVPTEDLRPGLLRNLLLENQRLRADLEKCLAALAAKQD